jgi:transcription termination/antitermination protein NusG
MTFKWYIVNVVSGQEQNVCNEINRIADKKQGIDKAFVPMKKVLKIKRGKKVEDVQKIFPSYVFAHLDLSLGIYDDVRSIPKVLGFLGSKIKPQIVSDEKVESILNKIEAQESEEEKVNYEIGDAVKVIEGPFESFTGTVEGKEENKKLLKISISIFGRPTVVDLDISKVEKL